MTLYTPFAQHQKHMSLGNLSTLPFQEDSYPAISYLGPFNAMALYLKGDTVEEIPEGYQFAGPLIVPSVPLNYYDRCQQRHPHPLLRPNALMQFLPMDPNKDLIEPDILVQTTPVLEHNLSSPQHTLSESSPTFSHFPPGPYPFNYDHDHSFLPTPYEAVMDIGVDNNSQATTRASDLNIKQECKQNQPAQSPNRSLSSASSTPPSKSGTRSGSRKRIRLTSKQQDYILHEFKCDNSPSTIKLKEIAAELGTSLRHVQYWFQNRRASNRRRGNEEARRRRAVESMAPYGDEDESVDVKEEGEEEDDQI
ncbi:hypothetical protein BCR33DRAFT_711659 [Rhizoclosmatium globosum]|uniref:Homeobox domain-containing protein n=1 Tax=Rhizoclosmatium globosum TaxID=329046 RepID=A0A1Y2CZ81_9FUNG|nr:hypothetical protein BCR33DRAFT_711659 [Rhizoclosmatium globosum]|eukprot:ORY52329.1 hypothetical protein BCR33DRAFT_711659 [Rhizoclosmatium globosum]